MFIQKRPSWGLLAFGLTVASLALAFVFVPGVIPEEAKGRTLEGVAFKKGPEATKAPKTDSVAGSLETEKVFPAEKILAGEELEYEIRWNGIPAGRTLLRVLKKQNYLHGGGPMVWRLRMDTRSNRLVSSFYRVKDKATSIMDVNSGCSRFFSMEKREGDYRFMERIRFDYRIGAYTATYEKPSPAPDGRLRKWRYYDPISLEGKVLDPLSALYYLRGDVDLSKPEGVVLPICTDRMVWKTRIRRVGRKQLKIKGIPEKQWCVQIVPECGFNGLFQRRSGMNIWLHEKTRVVVKVEVEIPIGFCTVYLWSFNKFSPLYAYGQEARSADGVQEVEGGEVDAGKESNEAHAGKEKLVDGR